MQHLEGVCADGPYSWKYFGHVTNGMRNGHGMCWTFSRDAVTPMSVYTGEWVHDVQAGRGVVVFDRGHVYDGEWLDGMYHGQGTYSSPSYDASKQ